MNVKDLRVGDFYVYSERGICEYAREDYINEDLYYLFYFKNKRKCYARAIDIENKFYFYASNDKKVTLSCFDNKKSWQKKKSVAMLKIKEQSQELLEIYKKRSLMKGFKFSPDGLLQQQFEKDISFTPSDGQLRCVQEIKEDMESDKVMDRILCGDVGFGKTEVAMRVVFKAVQDKKQVVIVTPSKILSHQHFQDFTERFKNYNVNIALLDSKRNKKRTELLQNIKEGRIDVIIGTQNVLSDSVQYKDIGLMITDEEHKLGISIKEKIKKINTNIDVLSMTATPIPRTLNLASNLHIRDISIIDTPPHNKIPAITQSMQWNGEKIKDIINRELSRNGGVFVVNNNILELYQLKEELLRLIPDLKIAIIHGKMKNIEIENTMIDILQHKYNLVLATSIIEVGITVKFINTIVICNAQNLGLAQIHQLRGRINRGNDNKKGYCILTYPKGVTLDEVAQKRLKIICENSELNSGLNIAREDLAIRGAGEIVGLRQSGYMVNSIGLDFYMDLLNKQLKEIS